MQVEILAELRPDGDLPAVTIARQGSLLLLWQQREQPIRLPRRELATFMGLLELALPEGSVDARE